MAFKIVLLFCAHSLLVQFVCGQLSGSNFGSFGSGVGGGIGGISGIGGLGSGLGCGCSGVSNSGGGFPTSSASPIAPYGISVVSENQYEGQLCVGGNLPLLGTVALEGVVPTNGNGAVSYGCGDSSVGITSENNGAASPNQYGSGLGFGGIGYGGIGHGSGLGGCGCGGLY